MKKLILLFSLVVTFTKPMAQTVVKTIPGVLINNIYQSTGAVDIAPNGSSVLIKGNENNLIINLEKGTLTKASNKLPLVSRDHHYSFQNTDVTDERPDAPMYWTRGIRIRGLLNDTILRTIINDHHIFGFDDQGRMIGTRISFTKNFREITGMRGLYIMDRNTGAELQTLRSDTLFTSGWLTKDGSRMTVALQKAYVALEKGRSDIDVFPTNGDPKVSIVLDHSATAYGMFSTDENYIYQRDELASGFTLKAYDRRTGKKAAEKNFTEEVKQQILVAFYNDHIYRFDRKTSTAYEDEIRNGNFETLRTWQAAPGFALPDGQRWHMGVSKGTALFFVPANIEQAEKGGTSANTASLLQLNTGKVSFRVAPFFNRSSEIAAKQAAEKLASEEAYARVAKEREQAQKDAEAKKQALCKTRWGTTEFNKGVTRTWGIFNVILESYDCDKDRYRFWIPKQDADKYNVIAGKYETDNGDNFRMAGYKLAKQYYTCSECDGDGYLEVTVYTTKTKDLPWGYFSGIETKKITTTSTRQQKFCNHCDGRGVILK